MNVFLFFQISEIRKRLLQKQFIHRGYESIGKEGTIYKTRQQMAAPQII